MRNPTSIGTEGKLTSIRWMGAVCAATLFAFGCTPLEPGDSVFEPSGLATADAEPPGTTPVDPAWACLGTAFPIVAREPKRVTYIVGIVDFNSQPVGVKPVEGLSITVCDTASCSPSAVDVTLTNPVPPLPAYFWSIETPYNFSNGYLRLAAPGYTPIDYLFGGPMIGTPEGGNIVHGAIIPLLTSEAVDEIYREVGAGDRADPTRGMLAIRTLNCLRNPGLLTGDGKRSPQVQMDVVPATPAGATAWVLSTNNYASKDVRETDGRGVAGLVNVPAGGTIRVRGVATGGGPNGIGFGQVTLRIRPNVVTIAEVRPGNDLWGQ